MTFKFLIDECLSPTLVQLAIACGHVESTCVRDRGRTGAEDWQLVEWALAEDRTLVTHNSVDFRGKSGDEPGGHYNDLALHAGLVCLNSVHPMTVARQRRLFQVALDALATRPDLVNQSFEVFEVEDGTVYIDVYDLPGKPDL